MSTGPDPAGLLRITVRNQYPPPHVDREVTLLVYLHEADAAILEAALTEAAPDRSRVFMVPARRASGPP